MDSSYPQPTAEAAALLGAASKAVAAGTPPRQLLIACHDHQAAKEVLAHAEPGVAAPVSLLELAAALCETAEQRPLVVVGEAELVAVLAERVPRPSPKRLRALAVGLSLLERYRLADRPLPETGKGVRLLRHIAALEEEVARRLGAVRRGLLFTRAVAVLERAKRPALLANYRQLLCAAPKTPLEGRLCALLGEAVGGLETVGGRPCTPPPTVRFWQADHPLHAATAVADLAACAAAAGKRTVVVVPEFRTTGRAVAARLGGRELPFLAVDGPEYLAPGALRDLLSWLRLLLYSSPLAALRLLARPPFALGDLELAAAAKALRGASRKQEGVMEAAATLQGAAQRAVLALGYRLQQLQDRLSSEEGSAFLAALLATTGLAEVAVGEGEAALVALEGAVLLWQRLADLQPQAPPAQLARQLLAVAAAGLSPAGFGAGAQAPLTIRRLGSQPVGGGVVAVLLSGVRPLSSRGGKNSPLQVPAAANPPAALAAWLSAASEEAVVVAPTRDRDGRERVFPAAERLRQRWGGRWERPPLPAELRRNRVAQLAARLERVAEGLIDQPLGVEQELYDLLGATFGLLREEAASRAPTGQTGQLEGLLEGVLPAPAREAFRRSLAGEREGRPLGALLPRHGDGLALSPTDLANYQECPYRYKLSRLLRFPSPPNQNQRFGIALHQVLERFHRRYAPNPKLAAQREGLDRLEALLAAAWQRMGLPRGRLWELALGALRRYHGELASHRGEVTALEEPFALPLGRHLISGRIDRIDRHPDGSYELIDYKTSRPRARADLAKDIQLPLYALAARRRLGALPAFLTYHYVIDGVRERFRLDELEGGLVGAVQRAEAVASEIERFNFEPKPSFNACTRCEFLQICPAAEG